MTGTRREMDFTRHADRPLRLVRYLWPDMRLYREQAEILESVVLNDETYVPAANMMGKDFISSVVVLWFFLTRHPCRVVTTSVRDDHLRVLWGEIGERIRSCKYRLLAADGGPLVVLDREIRKVVGGVRCPISYVRGMVSEKGEGMAGHHAPHTLLIGDEASGIDDTIYTQGMTWAKRSLFIGNCNESQGFFRKAVEAGDLLAPPGG
jgi:hypothetical protein